MFYHRTEIFKVETSWGGGVAQLSPQTLVLERLPDDLKDLDWVLQTEDLGDLKPTPGNIDWRPKGPGPSRGKSMPRRPTPILDSWPGLNPKKLFTPENHGTVWETQREKNSTPALQSGR